MKRVLPIAWLVFASLGAAEPQWKFGAASVRITPEHPVLMYGYGGRNDPHQGVAADIFAKALALQDPYGKRAVMVTCDLGGVDGAMIDRIAQKLGRAHGLPRDAFLYNASHTHSGPWSWVAEDEAKDMVKSAVDSTREYIKALEEKLARVADEALGHLEPANLSWSLGMAPFVMNRREFTDRGIILGFNPKGPVDRSVLVLRVDDPQGKLRVVVMGVACHCTCSGSKNMLIDGDYAGCAQAELQTRFPGAQAMFLAGCGGDANPWPRGDFTNAQKHGATLAAEVARVLGEKMTALRPPLRTAFQTIALPVAPPESRDKLEAMAKAKGWQQYIGAQQLAILRRGEQPRTSYPMPIALWQFGSDLTLVGLGGEPVNGYVHLIEDAIGPTRLWVAGYSNDVFGYVPTARVLAEGGYESRGIDRGDAVGQFTPDGERVIIDAVKTLARQAGRTKPVDGFAASVAPGGGSLEDNERLASERAYQQALAKTRAQEAIARAKIDEEAHRLEPAQQFERLIQAAEEYLERAEFQSGIRVYNQAMTLKPADVPITDRIKKLQTELVAQNVSVPVRLISDGNTWVSIENARAPAKFTAMTYPMKPGNYQIIGRRKGYRDVTIPLQLRAGVALAPITVICDVAADQ